jgi:hypothetical protein
MTLHIQYQDARKRASKHTFSPADAPVFIGRRDTFTPQVNITWDDSVSRDKHARIFYDYNTWYIEHLSEKSRSQVNGRVLALGVPQELPAHAEVVIGATALTITHDQVDNIPDGVISERSSPMRAAPEVSEEQRFDVLMQVTNVLAKPGEDQLQRLLAVIRPLFPTMTSGGISLYRDKELYHPAFFPLEKANISHRLARRALTERRVFRWDRTLATGDSDGFSSLFGTAQALYAPILRGVNKLGVIYLHTAGAFSDDDLALLTAISEIIGADSDFDPTTAHLRLPSVFISYSRKDTAFMQTLVKDLRRQRITVWVDDRLRGSKSWQEQLSQAIERSDALALIMSPDSLQSEWVGWEIEEAQKAGKPIFPLWHRECDDIPAELDRLQRINLRANYDAAVLELAEELYELSGEEDTLESEPAVTRSPDIDEKIRILFLAANPVDTHALRLSEEIRTIQERIRGGKYRDQFDTIQQGWAVRYSDLQRYLLEHDPHIVHFSGHGGSDGAIMLENSTGNTHEINKKTLKLLFSALKDGGTGNVRCVILNACYSAVQAEAIAAEVGCVLGMVRAVSDSAAIAFAGAFYEAITFGRSVQAAFNLAEAAMSNTDEEETPQLLTKDVNANALIFCKEETS